MFARRMSDEINNLTLAELATDLLHQAAYRDGLGNSLYAPKYMVHNIVVVTYIHLLFM